MMCLLFTNNPRALTPADTLETRTAPGKLGQLRTYFTGCFVFQEFQKRKTNQIDS